MHASRASFLLLPMLFGGAPGGDGPRPSDIRVTHSGVGPLVNGTPFEKKRIEQLLSGYRVKEGREILYGLPTPVLTVSLDGRQILTAYPQAEDTGWLTVRIDSELIVADPGVSIGSTYEELSDLATLNCERAEVPDWRKGVELRAWLVCRTDGEDQIAFTFELRSVWAKKEHAREVPPDSELGFLKIKQIWWRSAAE